METSIRRSTSLEGFETKRLSWAAIFAGAVAAIAVSALLTNLGIGLGLAAFSTQSGAMTYAVSGILWLIVSTFIAMSVGGLIVGILVRTYYNYQSFDGFLHGFLVWSLASILAFLLITSVVVPPLAAIASGAASNPALVTQARNASNNPAPAAITQDRTGTERISTTPETEKSVNYAGGLSLLTFFLLLIGLAGALIGAQVGVKEYPTTRI